MQVQWCDGEWIESQSAFIFGDDRSWSHGLSLFETLLAIDGKVRHWDLHCARIDAAGERFCWGKFSEQFRDAEQIFSEVIERNQLTHKRARLRLTWSAGAGNFRRLSEGRQNRIVIQATESAAAPESIRIGISPWTRNENSGIAGLKCGSYAENIVALEHAFQQHWDEVLFLNTQGEICEAACSNIFFVRDGVLLTAPLTSGCLPGTCRERVIQSAKKIGVPIAIRPIVAEEIATFQEAFLSNAIQGIVKVTHIDGWKSSSTVRFDQLKSLVNE